MSADVLRLLVAVLAVTVAGAALVTAARYGWAAIRLGRTPGRILARHVAEVALGTTGLVIGYAAAIGGDLGGQVLIPPLARQWMYLVSMLLLLVGLVEVAVYQTVRARAYPQRQAQVRDGIRAAIDRQRVTGPTSADRVAVLAANAVLALEGTPALDVPPRPVRRGDTDPETPRVGRHALRSDRGVR